MAQCRHLAITAILLLAGCVYNSRERADQAVCELTSHPYDQQPPTAIPPAVSQAAHRRARKADSAGRFLRTAALGDGRAHGRFVGVGRVAQPIADGRKASRPEHSCRRFPVRKPGDSNCPRSPRRSSVKSSGCFPSCRRCPLRRFLSQGRTVSLIPWRTCSSSPRPTVLNFGKLPAMSKRPVAIMIQANAYPNPTVSYQIQPSNNGSTPGFDGFGVDQTIKTGGKLRLQRAAAEMDLHNAELALRRARSDLATQVRNAYFAVLVAKETVRVNKALAHFTDEVYRSSGTHVGRRACGAVRTGGPARASLHCAAGLQSSAFRALSIPGSNSSPPSICGNCRSRKWPAASMQPSLTTTMTPSWPTSFATTRTC